MATTKPQKLRRKAQRFVDLLPLSDSATQAAIDAGYNVKDRLVARNIASENMAKPGIQAALREQLVAEKFAAILTIVQRKERLSRLTHPDPEHPDPVAAIRELNRMEMIGVPKATPPVVMIVKVVYDAPPTGITVEGEVKDATEK